MAKHSVSEELRGILAFVGVVWIVFLVDLLTPLSLNQWGLVPRTGGGLIGVVSMTFLHAGFGHLISNTCPLVILLGLLAGSRTILSRA